MSPVPPATSSSRCPPRGASQSSIASFQSRWMPSDMASFITSYLDATEEKTPWTRPAFSSSGMVCAPKWVVRPVSCVMAAASSCVGPDV